MKAGTLVAFGAGVLVCLIVANDWYEEFFTGLAAFATETLMVIETILGVVPPVVVVLAVLGIGLYLGTIAAERGRARKDADDAWDKRSTYRRG